MRHKQYTVVVGCLLMLSVTAFPVAAAEGGTKIGVVHLQRGMMESEEGKQAKAQLARLVKTKQALVDKKAKEVEGLKRELETQGKLLKEEVRREKGLRLERELKTYERLARDSQEEVQRRERKLTSRIVKALVKVAEAIGKEEGYSLILERVEGRVVFVSPGIDITDKVIARYNKQYKAKKGKK